MTRAFYWLREVFDKRKGFKRIDKTQKMLDFIYLQNFEYVLKYKRGQVKRNFNNGSYKFYICGAIVCL